VKAESKRKRVENMIVIVYHPFRGKNDQKQTKITAVVASIVKTEQIKLYVRSVTSLQKLEIIHFFKFLAVSTSD
jgi:hypothetical protein